MSERQDHELLSALEDLLQSVEIISCLITGDNSKYNEADLRIHTKAARVSIEEIKKIRRKQRLVG